MIEISYIIILLKEINISDRIDADVKKNKQMFPKKEFTGYIYLSVACEIIIEEIYFNPKPLLLHLPNETRIRERKSTGLLQYHLRNHLFVILSKDIQIHMFLSADNRRRN